MFVTFFSELKAAGVPVTLREYLTYPLFNVITPRSFRAR